MKKILTLLALLAVTLNVSADIFEVDGIWYWNKTSDIKTVEVTDAGEEEYTGDIIIPESVTYEGVEYTVTKVGAAAFYLYASVTSVKIPETVTEIGSGAFYGCSALAEVNIPNSVKSVGMNAFKDCTSLPVTDNMRYADTYLVETTDKTLSEYNIKEGTRFIGWSAFAFCTNLQSIEIPEGVECISTWAFEGCTALAKINIPESVTYVEGGAFKGCTSLPEFDNIQYADTYLVMATDKTLSEYKIKEGTRFIGSSAFEDCRELISIDIPESVTIIQNHAFSKCYKLPSITIPQHVTSLENGVFQLCYDLMNLNIMTEVPPTLGTTVFHFETPQQGTLHVVAGTADAYKAAEGWKNFVTIIDDLTLDAINTVESNETMTIYDLNGMVLGNDMNGVSKGKTVIVKQGNNTRKYIK